MVVLSSRERASGDIARFMATLPLNQQYPESSSAPLASSNCAPILLIVSDAATRFISTIDAILHLALLTPSTFESCIDLVASAC